jgi:hypothetical protein
MSDAEETIVSPAYNSSVLSRLVEPLKHEGCRGTCATHILTFLTLAEIFQLERVSRGINKLANLTLTVMPHYELSQYWFMLGQVHTEHFCDLLSRAQNLSSVNLSFCHHLKDDHVKALISAIPNKQNMKRLALYYTFELSDKVLEFCMSSLPNLLELNIGRCHSMTATNISRCLSRYGTKLVKLHLANNDHFVEDDTAELMETIENELVDLKFLDIRECPGVTKEYIAEVKVGRPGLTIVGPDRAIVAKSTRRD